MSDLQFIKATKVRRPGQIAEVYLWGGQQHLWISTVPDVGGPDLSPAARALFDIGNIAAKMIDRPTVMSGEETMAFLCDADGHVEDWDEVVMAVGPDSREGVFEQLREREPE